MKEKIKKYIGEIFVIIGSGLFSYNIFSFSYRIYGKGIKPPIPLFDESLLGPELEGIAYYYSPISLMLISIGVMLIISGIFIIRRKN